MDLLSISAEVADGGRHEGAVGEREQLVATASYNSVHDIADSPSKFDKCIDTASQDAAKHEEDPPSITAGPHKHSKKERHKRHKGPTSRSRSRSRSKERGEDGTARPTSKRHHKQHRHKGKRSAKSPDSDAAQKIQNSSQAAQRGSGHSSEPPGCASSQTTGDAVRTDAEVINADFEHPSHVSSSIVENTGHASSAKHAAAADSGHLRATASVPQPQSQDHKQKSKGKLRRNSRSRSQQRSRRRSCSTERLDRQGDTRRGRRVSRSHSRPARSSRSRSRSGGRGTRPERCSGTRAVRRSRSCSRGGTNGSKLRHSSQSRSPSRPYHSKHRLPAPKPRRGQSPELPSRRRDRSTEPQQDRQRTSTDRHHRRDEHPPQDEPLMQRARPHIAMNQVHRRDALPEHHRTRDVYLSPSNKADKSVEQCRDRRNRSPEPQHRQRSGRTVGRDGQDRSLHTASPRQQQNGHLRPPQLLRQQPTGSDMLAPGASSSAFATFAGGVDDQDWWAGDVAAPNTDEDPALSPSKRQKKSSLLRPLSRQVTTGGTAVPAVPVQAPPAVANGQPAALAHLPPPASAAPVPPAGVAVTSEGPRLVPPVPPAAGPPRKALLSFGDELEEEEGGDERAGPLQDGTSGAAGVSGTGSGASGTDGRRGVSNLSASTAHRFEKERSRANTSARGYGFGGGPLTMAALARSAAPSAATHGKGAQEWTDGSAPIAAPGDGSSSLVRTSQPEALGRVVFGVATARCSRPYMEDRHVLVSHLSLLSPAGAPLADDGVERSFAAVYDGHNGAKAAEAAAGRLHMLLATDSALKAHAGSAAVQHEVEEEAVGGALKRAFCQVDAEFLDTARREGLRDGSTALTVLRLGASLFAAHAGDSRAVLCRSGAALRLTEDHKPQLPQEKARVERAGGRVEWQRCWRVVVEPRRGRPGSGLAVSRALGDLDFKEPKRFVECEPDVLRLVPQPGDTFVVLASDGLWDVLSDQEACDCATNALSTSDAFHRDAAGGGGRRSGAPPSEADARRAAEALLSLSITRGTMDNVTVVVMLLQWA